MRSDLLRLSVFLASALSSAVAAAADPRPAEAVTAAGLLATFERSVAQLSCVHLETTETSVTTETAREGAQLVRREKPGSRTVDVTLYRDQYRWRLSCVNQVAVEFNGKKRELVSRTDFCLGEQLVIAVKAQPWDDGAKPDDLQVRGQYNASGVESSLRTNLGRSEVGILFGHADSLQGRPLWQIVRGAETLQLRPEMEEVDGIRTHVLRSVSREGTRTMWLDPDQGCLPRRIEIHRPPDDADFLYRYDKIRIERKQDLPIIMAFEVVTKATRGDGNETETRRDFRVKAIDFDRTSWPPTAFRGSIAISDGTPVLMSQDGGGGAAEYEWRDGRLRAKK